MCTLTWFRQPGGYQLFFNRDELRTRKPALLPARRVQNDTAFVAPLDGDFGGTWLGVNEFGLTLALLNGYRPRGSIGAGAPDTGEYTSRGLLLLSLIDSQRPAQVLSRLRQSSLDAFRPFSIVALGADGRGVVGVWSGGGFGIEPLAQGAPIVSSSFDTAEVCARRLETFRLQRQTAQAPTLEGLHLLYHESHTPESGPYSVCMHRPDAETVSFSWIQVDQREIRFLYSPRSPCLGRPGAPVASLPRH